MINYLNFFPEGYTPNPSQTHILTEISKAKNKGLKFVIVSAPTGSGKSHCAKTLANSEPDLTPELQTYIESGAIYEYDDEEELGLDEASSYYQYGTAILTMTKVLQDQYKELFSDGAVLKGQSNYQCGAMPVLSCDMGPCKFNQKMIGVCRDNNQCPHMIAQDEAMNNKCAFYSYAMFLSMSRRCRSKKILICDEASELEDSLVQQYTVPFNFKLLKQLDIVVPPTPSKKSTYESYLGWARSIKTSVFSQLNSLYKKYKTKKLSECSQKERLQFRATVLLNNACDKLLGAVDTEFIIEHTSDGLIFKPYRVNNLAHRIFQDSEFIVLMSATIIDHKNFAKQLGISPSEYAYIEAPSTFDPKKAPIALSNKVGVTHKNKATTLPIIVELAKHICDKHADSKGIIHTHSMEITTHIKNHFGKNKRFLYREIGKTNEMLIEMHSSTDQPTVLVSPSMSHGVDLKGDLGEFAIIMKAPFLPLGDLRIKRLAAEDPDWYMNKMLSTFIQLCGRTVRGPDDTSMTYVLDATILHKLKSMKDKIPKYILERFV